ncbi:4'-phosphopantetheinyl transferase family protein [Rodentibacter caecimuris]|uniref:4'-phosphopantetheinyl transferase n=1 Tax=Rodentibacter caecimuris TaxID=1796644 RepID=A0ABX3KY96_9PAST|nr:4'-phosphopantetheinyl transferase [Rodentibacter heylii]
MTTFITWANIRQDFAFEQIPLAYIPDRLKPSLEYQNARLQQRDKCRRLAHFLLWQLLKIAEKPTALLADIQQTQSGRPQFLTKNIDFNISHSGDWVAVILQIAEQGKSAVGIDIECPKERNFSALLAYFAPQAERNWFEEQVEEEKAFYRCWCLREAILKSQGVGIAKLSEVIHLPEQKKIYSPHCPSGQLFFTDELPFYLCAFQNEHENRSHFFQWNGNRLVRRRLNNLISYQVNLP